MIKYWKVSRIHTKTSLVCGVSSERKFIWYPLEKRDILNAHVKFINKSSVVREKTTTRSSYGMFGFFLFFIRVQQYFVQKKGVWLDIFFSLSRKIFTNLSESLREMIWSLLLAVSKTIHSRVRHTNTAKHVTCCAPTLEKHNPSLSDKNTKRFSSAFLSATFVKRSFHSDKLEENSTKKL